MGTSNRRKRTKSAFLASGGPSFRPRRFPPRRPVVLGSSEGASTRPRPRRATSARTPRGSSSALTRAHSRAHPRRPRRTTERPRTTDRVSLRFARGSFIPPPRRAAFRPPTRHGGDDPEREEEPRGRAAPVHAGYPRRDDDGLGRRRAGARVASRRVVAPSRRRRPSVPPRFIAFAFLDQRLTSFRPRVRPSDDRRRCARARSSRRREPRGTTKRRRTRNPRNPRSGSAGTAAAETRASPARRRIPCGRS
jgi:hypothetical protein